MDLFHDNEDDKISEFSESNSDDKISVLEMDIKEEDSEEECIENIMIEPGSFQFSGNTCSSIIKKEVADFEIKAEDASEAEPLENLSFVAIKEEPNTESLSDEYLMEEESESTSTMQEVVTETTSNLKGKNSKVVACKNINFTGSADHYREHFISQSVETRNHGQLCGVDDSSTLGKLRSTSLPMCVEAIRFGSSANNKGTRGRLVNKSYLEKVKGEQVAVENKSKKRVIRSEECNRQEEEEPLKRGNQRSSEFSERETVTAFLQICKGGKQYTCSLCGKRFVKSNNLTAHMQVHTGERPYKCNHCDTAFAQLSNLNAHMRIHTGERKYKCNQCGKAFYGSCNLKLHMRIHTQEKPYKCCHCDKAFSRRDQLIAHMEIHNGEKPYICSQCNKAFAENSALITHMQIHVRERPYKCKLCDKAFFQGGTRTAHMRTHTGEKPYKCNHCDKAYSRSYYLTVHMRVHSGEKPHNCIHCKKSFSRRDCLTTHLRIHKREGISV